MPETLTAAERQKLVPIPRAVAPLAPALWHKCLAECAGTFLVVLLGCGVVHAAVFAGAQAGLWQVAVVWGIAVALAIHMTAAISGGHLNPAMTAAFAAWKASLEASALSALENRAGHCSDYHGLCSALGRSLGYPTRVTYGWSTFAKSSLSHCKAEVFLPPYGWVSFDVSETQNLCKRVASEPGLDEGQKTELTGFARKRLFSGYRDNTWLLLTRGTDCDLAPPASRRAAVVRTIYAEADGEALPEPDPGDKKKREFAWMTMQSIQTDRPMPYPFKDVKGLEQEMERSR